MKIIITTENTELWRNLAKSFDDKNIKFIESYSDLENNTESKLVFCYQAITDFVKLENDLKKGLIESVILFYQQSEFAIASAINGGQTLEVAASHWKEKTNSLLTFQKQNRRKIKLINLEQANLNSSVLQQHLNDHGVSLQQLPEYHVPSDVTLLLSCQFVRQEQSLNELNELLTASSLPVSESTFVSFDNSYLLKQFIADKKLEKTQETNLVFLRARVEEKECKNLSIKNELEQQKTVVVSLQNKLLFQQQSAATQLDKVGREREQIAAQLFLVQEELEHNRLNFEATIKRFESTDNELKKKLKNAIMEAKNLDQEKNLFNVQLSQVQEELERYFLISQSYENEKSNLGKKVAFLEKKNLQVSDELAQSKESANSLKKQINDLVLAANIKDKALTRELQKNRVKQLEVDKLSAHMAKAKNEIEILSHSLNQVNAELSKIKSSALWKSTAPVRRLVKAVSNVDKKNGDIQRDIGLLLTSEYFDAKWYLETYTDVDASKINPAEHYLKFGAKEGRLPSPKFDGNWYLQRYPDIADADINPLIHFIKFGISEGRKASPTMLVNQNNS